MCTELKWLNCEYLKTMCNKYPARVLQTTGNVPKISTIYIHNIIISSISCFMTSHTQLFAENSFMVVTKILIWQFLIYTHIVIEPFKILSQNTDIYTKTSKFHRQTTVESHNKGYEIVFDCP